jgi:tetratricopeptide (TPR) repeat protein
MKLAYGILVVLVLTTAGWLMAQAPVPQPLTQKEVINLLKSKQSSAQLVGVIRQRGVNFEINPDVEKKLRKVNADDQLIQAVRDVGPSARAARAEESRETWAVVSELDPDRAIQLASDFEKKYPDSRSLADIYATAGIAYATKGEAKRAIEYGEKSLKLDPQNLRALLLLVPLLPQPQILASGGLDKEKKLADAESYAQRALVLIEQVPKQPNETDDQFQRRKAEIGASVHSGLGLVHLERATMQLKGVNREELAKAEEEYQVAVSSVTQPISQDYYRLGEVRRMLGKLDGAIEAFTKASELGAGTIIKTKADESIADLERRKAQTTRPKQ